MTQSTFMEKYPIFTLEAPKTESLFSSVDEIIDNLKTQIASDPVAAYIADFDHYAHTEMLGGEINPDIRAAKMVVFCFGQKLPTPQMMAARPRSIGVADMGENFVFTFLEAPMSAINDTMEGWVKKTFRSFTNENPHSSGCTMNCNQLLT